MFQVREKETCKKAVFLYGSNDNLTSFETVRAFVEKRGATLTVMEHGEHRFHTDEQMQSLDDWIRKSEVGK